MTDKLLNIDKKPDRYAARREGPIGAARISAAAMQDSFRGSDPQFEGNVADALYHIATALQQIADVVEFQWGPKP